jgi:hypothetical protein
MAAAFCYVAALELLVGLLLGPTLYFAVALPVGALIWVVYSIHASREPESSDADSNDGAGSVAFETSGGGRTLVEGGSVTGYPRISRVFSAFAHFVDVRFRRH